MSEHLAPCPFCGRDYVERDGEVVLCRDCHAEGPIYPLDRTREQNWNRRAAPAQTEGERVGEMLERVKQEALNQVRRGALAAPKPLPDGEAPDWIVQAAYAITDDDEDTAHAIATIWFAYRDALQPKPLPDAPGWWIHWNGDEPELRLLSGRFRVAGELPTEGHWIGPLTPPEAPHE